MILLEFCFVRSFRISPTSGGRAGLRPCNPLEGKRVSTVATVDLGRCPKNLPPFEKGGRKL
jgi:hypothetical protein